MKDLFARIGLTLVVLVSLLALSPGTPAQANAACGSNQLCLYPCYLNESCNAWFATAVSHGCYPTMAGGLTHLTYSVKNNTSKLITVYRNNNCTGTSAPLYAHTSGNMAYPWIGAGIQSFRVPT